MLDVDNLKLKDFYDLELRTLDQSIEELQELITINKNEFLHILLEYKEYKRLFNGNGEILCSFTMNNKYNFKGRIFVKNNKVIDLIAM